MAHFKELLEVIYGPPKTSTDIIPIIVKLTSFPIAVVRKGIAEGRLTVNDKQVRTKDIFISRDSSIKFQNAPLQIDTEPLLDRYVDVLLEKNFDQKPLSELSIDEQNRFCAFLVEYFSRYGYDVSELTKSKANEIVMSFVEDFYRRNFQAPDEPRTLRKKQLIDKLLDLKKQELNAFANLVSQMTTDFYDLESQKPFQDFSHVFNKRAFKHLIKPLLTFDTDPIQLLQKIIKSFRLVSSTVDPNEKISNRSKVFKEYESMSSSHFRENSDPVSTGFKTLIDFFTKKTDSVIGFKDTGKVIFIIEPEEKRAYNFTAQPLYIYAYLKNDGSGIAKDINIFRDDQWISIPRQQLAEILAPGETRKVKFLVHKIDLTLEKNGLFNIVFKLQWQNDFKEQREYEFRRFNVQKQNENLPWEELKRTNPYSLIVVDDPNKLFGRDKLLEDLKWNIAQNHSITSFVFYGQKRVGKSSIIRTLDTIYKDDANVIFIYRTMGDVKNTDPNRTLQKLGESIATKLIHEFKRKNPKVESHLREYTRPSFVGSLAPLNEIIEFMHDLNEKMRVIIALDEFDELNNEFFENGEIGKTFALNIGKGLNEKSYVGLILIGSESMEYKTKQGMRLNAFTTKKVDTFDKQNEFDYYRKIISEPTKSCITFSPDVFDYLFDYTNGNPYYTNSLLQSIFREAYEKRLSFIDIDFVLQSVKHQVSNTLAKKDFEHFWNDGLSEDELVYEKILDRRRRFLTAFAQVKKENNDCRWLDIKKKIKLPKKFEITESQMEETVNEFKQRGIVLEKPNGVLDVIPHLFQDWLLGPGLYQVIAQLEDKDDILDRVLQEQKLLLSDDEISETLTFLNENKDKTRAFRDYINQFEENNSRRLMVDLLRKSLVISSEDAIDFIRKTRREIWGNIELGIGDRDIRTDAELVCFDDSVTQNNAISETIRNTFKFVHNKGLKRIADLPSLEEEIRHIIIYEPLIDCPYYYKNELAKLIKKVNPISVRDVKVHLLAFVISDEAKNEIEEFVSKNFAFDFVIHSLKLVQRSDIAPYLNGAAAINDPTWKVISSFKKETSEISCLIKIGDLIPYQCFPILWDGSGKFKPLFRNNISIDVYKKRMLLSSKLKELSFTSETNELELKASLSEPAPNWKEILSKSKALKSLRAEKVSEIQALKAEIGKLFQLRFEGQEKLQTVYLVKHAIAKTLAAFANTNGGVLYVGIDDDFTISGVIYDLKVYKSHEAIRRELDNIVTNYLGAANSGLFQLDIVNLDSPILKIRAVRSPGEVWVKIDKNGKKLEANKEEIYIRAQQETRQLMTREYFEWKQKKIQ